MVGSVVRKSCGAIAIRSIRTRPILGVRNRKGLEITRQIRLRARLVAKTDDLKAIVPEPDNRGVP